MDCNSKSTGIGKGRLQKYKVLTKARNSCLERQDDHVGAERVRGSSIHCNMSAIRKHSKGTSSAPTGLAGGSRTTTNESHERRSRGRGDPFSADQVWGMQQTLLDYGNAQEHQEDPIETDRVGGGRGRYYRWSTRGIRRRGDPVGADGVWGKQQLLRHYLNTHEPQRDPVGTDGDGREWRSYDIRRYVDAL
jgi:hypothetical protein